MTYRLCTHVYVHIVRTIIEIIEHGVTEEIYSITRHYIAPGGPEGNGVNWKGLDLSFPSSLVC